MFFELLLCQVCRNFSHGCLLLYFYFVISAEDSPIETDKFCFSEASDFLHYRTIFHIVLLIQTQNGLQSRFTVKRPCLKQTQIVFLHKIRML